ncbi:MAG: hypothetical protein P1U77_23900 [Rubripirellula sp.]|jgi:hypothetical protein|nr:hypothetical protein [Rubripirellula sp.]
MIRRFRTRSFIQGLALLLPLIVVAGCGTEENTVIVPSGDLPTAQETEEYEQEVADMMSERD